MTEELKDHTIYFRLVKGTNLVDRIIRWYTRSDYSHAEFSWPLNEITPSHWLGARFKGGVQARPYNYVDSKFSMYSVAVTKEQYDAANDFLIKQIGKKYDWKAIVNMGVFKHDIHVNSTVKWFCSELLFYLFRVIDVILLNMPLSEKDRITPRDIGISTVPTCVSENVSLE